MILKHRNYKSPLVYTKKGEKIAFGRYVPHFTEVPAEIGKDLVSRHEAIREATKEEFADAESDHLAAIESRKAAQAEAAANQE